MSPGMWILGKVGKRYANEMGNCDTASAVIVRALEENRVMSTEELTHETGRPMQTILNTLKDKKIIEEL
jgi:hypothetical protein